MTIGELKLIGSQLFSSQIFLVGVDRQRLIPPHSPADSEIVLGLLPSAYRAAHLHCLTPLRLLPMHEAQHIFL